MPSCACVYRKQVVEMDATCEDCRHNKLGPYYAPKFDDCLVGLHLDDLIFGSDKDHQDSPVFAKFHYCPICGRKL